MEVAILALNLLKVNIFIPLLLYFAIAIYVKISSNNRGFSKTINENFDVKCTRSEGNENAGTESFQL